MLKIKSQKPKLIPVLFLVFLGLFLVAQPARADFLGIVDSIWGAIKSSLDALDFIDTTILKYLVTFGIVVVFSQAFLFLSAFLLDWAINLPVQVGNNLVMAGWNFTSGLVNLFFILALVAIAFFWIFKMETWGMKKALPRLIIIALLINFSLLFVKIFVDIGDVFLQSLLTTFGKPSVFSWAKDLFSENFSSFITIILGIPSAYILMALIPGVSSLVAAGIGTWFLLDVTGVTGGFFLNTLVWVFLSLVLGLVFLAYFLLFLIRIIAIWLLAIFAPLALFAYIFPKTEKFFSEWLKNLLNWVFLGVVALFLLGLGIKLFGIVSGPETIEIGGRGTIFFPVFPYLFLIVYLIVCLYAAKKFTPKGTEMVWQVGAMALTRSMGLTTPGAGALTRRFEIKRAEKRQAEAKRIAAEMKAQNRPITLRERLKTGVWTRRPTPEKVFEAGKRAEVREKRLKETALAREIERVKGWGPGRQNDELLRQQRAVMKNFERIAAIVQQQAEKGKIGPEAEKLIKEAVKGGANPDLILARRPDLATTLGKNIKDVMDKIDAKTFREKTQIEAMRHPEVIKNFLMDGNKFDEFTKNASRTTKAAIKEGFVANAPQLKPNQFPSHYQAVVKDRLTKMFKTSPRWQTK